MSEEKLIDLMWLQLESNSSVRPSRFESKNMVWFTYIHGAIQQVGWQPESHLQPTAWKDLLSRALRNAQVEYFPGEYRGQLSLRQLVQITYRSQAEIPSHQSPIQVQQLAITDDFMDPPIAIQHLIHANINAPYSFDERHIQQTQLLVARHLRFLDLGRSFDKLLMVYVSLLTHSRDRLFYTQPKSGSTQLTPKEWFSKPTPALSIRKPRFIIGFLVTGLHFRYPDTFRHQHPDEVPFINFGKQMCKETMRAYLIRIVSVNINTVLFEKLGLWSRKVQCNRVNPHWDDLVATSATVLEHRLRQLGEVYQEHGPHRLLCEIFSEDIVNEMAKDAESGHDVSWDNGKMCYPYTRG
jgi:hypothetical protein